MCPCHDGMALPPVADGGTASDMEGSCEYIKSCKKGEAVPLQAWSGPEGSRKLR